MSRPDLNPNLNPNGNMNPYPWNPAWYTTTMAPDTGGKCLHKRVASAPYTLAIKSTVSATKSTATSCRIQVVANLLSKPATKVDRIGNKVDRDKLSNSSCCRFVAKTGNKVDRISNKVRQQ